MRRLALALILASLAPLATAVACRTNGQPVGPTGPEPAPPVEPGHPVAPQPPADPNVGGAGTDGEPPVGEDPCVTECVRERQMQATSIDVIRAGCQRECEEANGQGDDEEAGD